MRLEKHRSRETIFGRVVDGKEHGEQILLLRLLNMSIEIAHLDWSLQRPVG
jgi:hypothetical protein